MSHCLLTYDEIAGKTPYSRKGLPRLASNLAGLQPFPYIVEEQLQLAAQLAAKLSIQGVQPKLSAILDVRAQTFVAAKKGGQFILKPQNLLYMYLPENEDLV